MQQHKIVLCKLTHFAGEDDGAVYDLDQDPRERDNLWADPAHSDIRRHLISEILDWRIRSAKKTQGFIGEMAHRNEYPL